MLSIVIPTKNEEEYLPYLLLSIQRQTFRNFEVIVADAGSTDQTRQIAADFGARIIEGGPVAVGRNNGAAVAKGSSVLFLDADVVLPDPWFLQMTVAEFEKKGLDAATCRIKPLSDKKIDKVVHDFYNYFMVATQKTAPHAPGFCIFARRDVHNRIGGFDAEIKLAEDHDYVSRVGAAGLKFGVLKTYMIPVSVRRFDRDGRANIIIKYLLCELHMRTAGPVKDLGPIRAKVFEYNFGHPKKNAVAPVGKTR